VLFDAYGEKVGEIGDPSIPIDELPQVWTGMRRDTKLDLYTAGDGNWYKSSLGMYLTQANPSDFVNPYRFAGGDPVSRESLTNFLQYKNYNNFAGVMTDGPSFGQLYGHYLNPRIFGVSQALFGVAEVIGGAASCPAIVGCLVAAHGLDDLQAGLLTAVTGEYYETLTKQAARAVTGSETAATVVDIGTGLASGAAASRLGQAGRLAQSSAKATATVAPRAGAAANYELYKAVRAQGYNATDAFNLIKGDQQLIWHYTRRAGGFAGDTIEAGAAGRIWATTHAPTGWHNSSTIGGWLQRNAFTGRGGQFTDVKLVTGAVRDEFAPVFAIGPARGWKRLGGQYSTTRPGSWR
jgi:hypothetical protein